MTKIYTIDDLIHPFQKGSMAITLKVLEKDLMKRFLRNIQLTIKSQCIIDKDTYYIHIKIPSEINPESDVKVFYDVLFKFFPTKKDDITLNSIRGYRIQVFSNIPSFMFTFTYGYNKKHLLIPLNKKYYSKEALKSKASIRNPLDLLGINKAIWFSFRYMEKNRLFTKTIFSSAAKDIKFKDLIQQIDTQDNKFEEVQKRNILLKRQKRKIKKAEEKRKSDEDNDNFKFTTSLKENLLKSNTLTSKTLKNSSKTNNLKKSSKANLKSSLSKN